MKKTRFSEEQLVKILREADQSPVAEVAKKHGISDVTIHAWRKRFGKLEPVDVKRLRHLEQENAKLKKEKKDTGKGQNVADDLKIMKEVALRTLGELDFREETIQEMNRMLAEFQGH